jgi:NADH-quinone oxidoreductase subunit D
VSEPLAAGTRAEPAAGPAAGERSASMRINMGPSHPAMHGTIRLELDLDGEVVRAASAEIGYLHRAFEKTVEHRTWNQVVPYTDRLNYVSPIINNVGYALAVEKLFGIQVPPRGQYVRVLMSELSRICDHLTCNGAMGMEAGAMTVFIYLIKARELIWQLMEEVTGARLTVSWTRVGGVTGDVTDRFLNELPKVLAELRIATDETTRLLKKNRIFYDRLRGVGVLDRDTAISWAITGPCGRASGVDYDVRRDQPYLVYDKLDFKVPLGELGDTYDRFFVRMQEIEQSVRIIQQCVRDLPPGPVNVDDQRVTLPPKPAVYSDMESLIHHFKLLMPGHGIRPPAGEAYVPIEGANGELGFYVVSDGADRPYRVRVRPPCFFPMSAIHKLIEGSYVADIIPIFGSINMIAGELDR